MLTTALTPELSCTDFEASLRFYIDMLGFAVQYQRPEDGFAMLERQGSRLMLDRITAVSITGTDRTWQTGPMEKPFGRGINFQMQTTDVDGLYARVLAAKWPVFRSMEEKWYRMGEVYGGNRQFLVQDPDGYLLRFFEDLGTRPNPP